MTFRLVSRAPRGATPVTPVEKTRLRGWLRRQPRAVRAWVEGSGFTAEPGAVLLVPGDGGRPGRVLLGVGGERGPWDYAGLPTALPAGTYRLDADLDRPAATRAALGWALGTYAFARYRRPEERTATLLWPAGADRAAVERAAGAVFLVRDLINTPAGDMGPAELAAAARRVARRHGARLRLIRGDALLRAGYPAVHAVGRASSRPPCLIDMTWGPASAPRVTLVGKGVCFDTGGLNLKPHSAMKLMKKDKGGAAQVLGLADMIMAARLGVRLRVLVPAVENSVSGNAMRPLDVLRTRKGLTVEVGHTDAEGRLILADALAEAARERPDLVIDCATLTGAARVALGPELPALFCNDDDLAAELLGHGEAESDPLWRLPLWRPYRKELDSKVADINNVSDGPYGGAITAALFLAEFVGDGVPWVHLDIMAWNPKARPGRPEGGEAMGLRALYALLAARYGGGRTRGRRKRRPARTEKGPKMKHSDA